MLEALGLPGLLVGALLLAVGRILLAGRLLLGVAATLILEPLTAEGLAPGEAARGLLDATRDLVLDAMSCLLSSDTAISVPRRMAGANRARPCATASFASPFLTWETSPPGDGSPTRTP